MLNNQPDFGIQTDHEELVRRYTALIAPGSVIRDGLERIQHGHTGALVVLGRNELVDQVSTGGFNIDTEFTPTALRELAKMDGAIILNTDLDRIEKACVHLVPDGSLPTIETGTRHRTADRVSRQTGIPVITVSAAMSTIALFIAGTRHPVERSEYTLTRASQALATLTRYRESLDHLVTMLSALEISDQVTARDVVLVAQRLEMMRRLETEIRGYIASLGVDGRLPQMQLLETMSGINELSQLFEEDYAPEDNSKGHFALANLTSLTSANLVDIELVLEVMGFDETSRLDSRVSPRGYRLTSQIPRLPQATARKLVDYFGYLQALLGATTSELMKAGGLSEKRARTIQDSLARITDLTLDAGSFK